MSEARGPGTGDASSTGRATGPAPGRGEEASTLFAPEVIVALRDEIRRVGGVEVFFYGRSDERGRVVEIEVAARGNAGAAPAVLARAQGMDVAIHNHPDGFLLPSEADLGVAAALGNLGVGFAIISNDAARVNLVVPLLPARKKRAVGDDAVEAGLGPRGSLASRIVGYESRPGQLDMARAVARAFRDEKVSLLEAGTGTGKTFAYLVPAILWATENHEKVVVSTGTIPLQEQILTKDVPALRSVLPPFSATVVKGRSNYVSLRRADEAARSDAAYFDSESERLEVERLVAWAGTTKTGDRAELTPVPSPEAWERVESQSDNCLRTRCPTYAECHYFQSRRAAARSDVLVVNHALLVTDLAVKREMDNFAAPGVLPPYGRLIVDEAHHLEEVAAEHLGARVTARGLSRLLGRLRNRRDILRGLVPNLGHALDRVTRAPGCADPGKIARSRLALDEHVEPLRARAVEAVELACAAVVYATRVAAHATAEGPTPEASTVGSVPGPRDGTRGARTTETKHRLRDDPASRDLVEPFGLAREAVGLLVAEIEGALDGLEEAAGDALPLALASLLELGAVGRRLKGALGSLDTGRDLGDGTRVRWLEVGRDRRGEDRCELHAAPLDVAPVLKESLLDRVRTAVFSSATLTVGGRFDYLERGLGVPALHPSRVERLEVASPFDFGRQAVLGVPLDLPDPSAPDFDEATARILLDAVRISKGRAFVLFTSYRALERVHRLAAPGLAEQGLVAIKQGEAGRRLLLERFKSTRGAVLFGTDSFWEGVDVPGDGLVLVVIAKLPFRVPSEPIEEARAEAVRSRGGDPFRELMLPRAVLKLKQGFGRLIRTRSDHGAVLVLDRRIVRRDYGRAFIASLPEVSVSEGTTAYVLDAVARVLGAPRGARRERIPEDTDGRSP